MKSIINVYRQVNDGLIEYYVFLDILEGEGITCPANDNSDGFNYSKADLMFSCDWYESQICADEFDMIEADKFHGDDDFQDIQMNISLAVLSCAANSMKVYEFITNLNA